VSYGLPGGKGLFSPIQLAMSGSPDFINMTHDIQVVLSDWVKLLMQIKKTPTSVLQLTSNYPDNIGYSDACRLEQAQRDCIIYMAIGMAVRHPSLATNRLKPP
jgi:hypothetical protein